MVVVKLGGVSTGSVAVIISSRAGESLLMKFLMTMGTRVAGGDEF